MPARKSDPYLARCRELALRDGVDPDSRVPMSDNYEGRTETRTMPAWCRYRAQARAEHNASEPAAFILPPQPERFQNSSIIIFGQHEASTLDQMRNCMKVGNAAYGVVCADGHLGYAQPVGGVIAYEDQISISGVGFDIACGNLAVRLNVPYETIKDNVGVILRDISNAISFGVGRRNETPVQHTLFDDADAWRAADREDFRSKAMAQLGTVGGGNHYVDLLRDEAGFVWIGVHFGSRGLGHSTATKYLKAAGGKDGINVPPCVVEEHSEIGQRYLAAMELAGRYAYAGREWVVERVRSITGGKVIDSVHNHHNYAWRETHGGKKYWVVRKGATPAFPGQRGFVGGSMGDDAVIVRGRESPESALALYSTIHGAGRTFGRKEAKRCFTREQMDMWLRERGVAFIGGDLD